MSEHRDPREDHIEITPVEARQGTGPRDMVTVLAISLLLAVIAGLALWAYFVT